MHLFLKLILSTTYPIKKEGFAPIEVIGNLPLSSSYDFPKIAKPELIKGVTKKLGPLEDNLINLKHLIKLSEYEKTDMTIASQELACSSGFCEIQ